MSAMCYQKTFGAYSEIVTVAIFKSSSENTEPSIKWYQNRLIVERHGLLLKMIRLYTTTSMRTY